jgi:hypothetical protein
MIAVGFVLGLLWLLQGLAAAVVVLNPWWKEGLVVRLGLVLISVSSVPLAIEMLVGAEPSARGLANACVAQAAGFLLVVAGWGLRSWRRGAPQRRHTDWGGLGADTATTVERREA